MNEFDPSEKMDQEQVFCSVAKVIISNNITEENARREIDFLYSRMNYPKFMDRFVSYMPKQKVPKRENFIFDLKEFVINTIKS